MQDVSRRTLIRALGTVGVGGLAAGCTADGGDGGSDGDGSDENGDGDGNADGTTVAVGPGGSLSFDPRDVTIAVGETVTWEFESPSHNVSAVPDDSPEAEIPDGAEPFASYGDGSPRETDPQGSTFDHTFETPGEYTYVCVPHIGADMIGTVTVEE